MVETIVEKENLTAPISIEGTENVSVTERFYQISKY